MLRAVIFDLDGTLIDSTEAIVASMFHMFDVMERTRPLRQAIIDSIGHPLEVQLTYLTDCPPAHCIPIYRRHYAEHSAAQTFLLPGARETLEALQAAGLRLAFATSKSRISAEMLLEHLGVLHFFEARIGPEEVQHTKPHPEAVLRALEALEVGPNEAIFVGDMHFDVLAGAAAGVRTLALTTGYATRRELEALQPEAVFDSLLEVRDYVMASIKTPAILQKL
ncbi:MAG: HAD-IA family hydrolase [Candidatus Hydrogenedentes bacterium]|nr:HAD-IA family hydrolase [Candidatus Hydrogenedentota bacterium]